MGSYYIVRHGETLANRSGILQGHLNVPLSGRGKRQAELVGKALSEFKIHAVYSSDLDRARETAAAIAKYHDCKLIPERRLREVHCGGMQGRTMDESRRLFPEFFKALQKVHYIPPGQAEGNHITTCTRELQMLLRILPRRYWYTSTIWRGLFLLPSARSFAMRYQRSRHLLSDKTGFTAHRSK